MVLLGRNLKNGGHVSAAGDMKMPPPSLIERQFLMCSHAWLEEEWVTLQGAS